MVAARARGRPIEASSASASAAGAGKRCVRPSFARSTGVPKARTSRPASVVAPRTVTCWPSTARTASSKASHAPGTRNPGRRAPSGATTGPRLGRQATGRGAQRVGEGADAADPGRERDVRHGEGRLVEQRAREVDPARARHLGRRGTERGGKEPAELPRADAEPIGEAGDAALV